MRAGALVALGLIALAPALGGCGFTPLYATPGVTPNMAAIHVVTPEGRTGHLLSEDLQDDFAIARNQAPRYQLDLSVDEKRYARGLTFEQVATWYELSLRVSYSLIDLSSGRTLTSGVMPISVSYNAANDPYAGIVAQQDGQQRAASDAAQRIRIAIAAYFAGSPIKTPSTSLGS
jgi:LPS-assembly lipoprotein